MGLKIENIYDDINLYIFIVIILVLIEFLKCNKKYNGYLIRLKEGIGIKWIWLLIGLYLLKYHFKISIIYTLIWIGVILNESKKSIDDILNDYSRLINK
jgi:hypothetical protein